MDDIVSALLDAFEDILRESEDVEYEEELQLQEALKASLNMPSSSLSSSSSTSLVDPSSSISTSRISCKICTEDRETSDMFQLEGCPHAYCSGCISKHVEYKLKNNIALISCPDEDCNNFMQPSDSLSNIISLDVFNKWEEAMILSTILDSQKIHCPYENCSEMLINDSDEGDVLTESECPKCQRLFCAQCKVPWHAGLDCQEFQRSKENRNEKEKLRLLAEEKKWKKCPNCRVFVDKTEGCIHITCRCKFEFCYACGSSWNETHWNICQK